MMIDEERDDMHIPYLSYAHLLVSAAWSHTLWEQGYHDGFADGLRRNRAITIGLSIAVGMLCWTAIALANGWG